MSPRATTSRSSTLLRLPALEIQQGETRRLYSFAVDGKQVPSFATVSRIRRDDTTLHGYQRPEVLSHVAAIRRYLETDAQPLLPNAIVIAFDSRVKFVPGPGTDSPYARMGVLEIPVDDEADKPGFIVDGQQRSAAIRDAKIESFPICVTAFIADSIADQRSQFILVNSTRALPKGLIHELLPDTAGALPLPLLVRQLPAKLLDRLNFTRNSPLFRMIQTPTNPEGVIKDNSMLRLLENSLSNGALYGFRGGDGGPHEAHMIDTICNYFDAVRQVFPEAWGLKPSKSRLMHGAGIISMGFLMDDIWRTMGKPDRPVEPHDFAAHLKPIAEDCRWTGGDWDFGDGVSRKWNDVQNTPRDIQRLADFLLAHHRSTSGRATKHWQPALDG